MHYAAPARHARHDAHATRTRRDVDTTRTRGDVINGYSTEAITLIA